VAPARGAASVVDQKTLAKAQAICFAPPPFRGPTALRRPLPLAVTLRLKRFGRLNLPTYRVVATDPRSPRDGRIIEALGYYLPLMPRAQEQLKLDLDRIKYWLSVGAKPSDTVASMIRRSGVAIPHKKQRVRNKSKAKPKPWTPPKKKVPRPPKKKVDKKDEKK
jgi:small subunit ribosomal protein S16